MDTLDLTNPVEPPAPDPANLVAFERWKYVNKEYMTKMQEYMNFCSGLYNIVMGQCTEVLKEHLKYHEDFVGANQNGIALLILICYLLHTFEECQKLADGLSDLKMAFYKLRQGKYIKLEHYHEIFLAQVEVLDEVGVTVADMALVQHVAQQHGRDEPVAADHEEAKQIALSIQFFKGTNACWDKSTRMRLSSCRGSRWRQHTTIKTNVLNHPTRRSGIGINSPRNNQMSMQS